MSRLLSQQEVDALLTSFDPGSAAAAPGAEQPFDLRAPVVLAGDRLAMVQAACERIAHHFAESLTLQLLTDKAVKGELSTVVQQPATTVISTLNPGEALGLLLDEHGDAVGGISLQPELAHAIIDRLQGGQGMASEGSRLLSPVESKLLESALARLVRYLDRHTALRPIQPGPFDNDAVFGKLATRGGMIATAMLRMSTPRGVAMCRLLLTPVLLNRLLAQAPEPESSPVPADLRDALTRVPVRVEPVLQGGRLTFSDLLRLAPGRVVQLDAGAEERFGLRFNGALLARGTLAKSGGERLVAIEEWLPDTDATGDTP